MNKQPINALLFDFDGTLLDTNELIIQTFLGVLGNHFPGKYTREDCLPFIGPTLRDSFFSVSPEMTDQLIQEYRQLNETLHDELAVEYDGVTETLNLLKEKGIKMAIVSTKRQDMIARGLKLMGLENFFEVIIGLDDVQHAKPHPEPLELAMKALGVSKEETMMVGDNSHDVEGGQAAGVRTAGVAWSAKGEAFLMQFHPDYMLQHISDLLTIVEENRA